MGALSSTLISSINSTSCSYNSFGTCLLENSFPEYKSGIFSRQSINCFLYCSGMRGWDQIKSNSLSFSRTVPVISIPGSMDSRSSSPSKVFKMARLTSKWFDPDHIGVTKYEATSKGYFVPADRDPDHIQRIKNGDLSTEVEILYGDGRLHFLLLVHS